MSVSMSYNSTARVSPQLTDQLTAEANALAHNWWSEGISWFEDPTGAGRAFGDTKLFLSGSTSDQGDWIEVTPEDDSAMAWRGAAFILEQLEKWSREHGIEWQLSCAGSVIGTIDEGVRDQNLADFLASMREISEFEEPLTEERIARIDAQHANRWD